MRHFVYALKGPEYRVLVRKVLIYTLVTVKKCHVESLTLWNIMTTYLKEFQTHENWCKPIFVPWTKKWFPLHLYVVLKISWFVNNVHGLLDSYLYFSNTSFFLFWWPNWALVALKVTEYVHFKKVNGFRQRKTKP